MKTGLGLSVKLRFLLAKYCVLRFWLYKKFLGFDVANHFITTVDKISLKLILQKNGAQIGHNCDIETGLTFHNCQDYSNLIIGNNCHIGMSCFFDLRGKVIIEDNVVVSMKVTFITHQDLSKSDLSILFPATSCNINVKHNCYIGAGALILKGINIGESSIVAAGAVLVNNVEPYSIVGGVPARKISSIIQRN